MFSGEHQQVDKVQTMLEKIKGLDFPVKFSSYGNLTIVSGEKKLLANLKTIVTTSVNQRVMRPTYGVPSEDLLFSKIQSISTLEIKSDIIESISLFEPRVVLTYVDVKRKDIESTFYIDIGFKPNALGYQSEVTFNIVV